MVFLFKFQNVMVLLTCLSLYTCNAFRARGRSLKAMSAKEVEIAPVNANIGTEVPLTYFGPAPSDVLKELVGPYQLLKSGAEMYHHYHGIILIPQVALC